MELKARVNLIKSGYAQGAYSVYAKGYFLGELRWGNEKGPLEEWSPMGYIPIDPLGYGSFYFHGNRAIPDGVTHVWVHCISHDFSTFTDISAEIPEHFLPESGSNKDPVLFSFFSDIHLSGKTTAFTNALKKAEGEAVFLLGDITNDGLPEQFLLAQKCIADYAGGKPVFCIPGNHDMSHPEKTPDGLAGSENYAFFQKRLLEKAENFGFSIEHDAESLAFAVEFGSVDLIGLQGVRPGRKFGFPNGTQIDWLENRLDRHRNALVHIILCHVPLLSHCLRYQEDSRALDEDQRLQKLLYSKGNIIFVSGHTHSSPNIQEGCVQSDEIFKNIYLDCGSATATYAESDGRLMAEDWQDGCIWELEVSKNRITICARSVVTGKKFPRGYYRFYYQN